MSPSLITPQHKELWGLLAKQKSPFDEKTRAEMVLKALIEATEGQPVATLNLTKTAQNGLDKLYRHEIVSVLQLLPTEHGPIFKVEPSNFPQQITVEAGGPFKGDPTYKYQLVPEDQPIVLTLFDGFYDWRLAYLQGERTRLDTLSPQNFEKVFRLLLAIEEKYQLRLLIALQIGWDTHSLTENATAREDALLFLKKKGVIGHYAFVYSNVGLPGHINVVIRLKEFQQILEEAKRIAEERNKTKKSTPAPVTLPPTQDDKPFKHLKWEDISIQFLDGHSVRISGKNAKVTANFKELGFEDARNRNPNRQWEFLKLLAASDGAFSWDNPKADDSAKKKKQFLSKTLREYFGIKSDPFYPYKEGQSYRIKIALTPESP